ncbi:MAG: cysteine--tRNA ligase [SAR202 cluster bacterium]|nr:cysteine--tRNA ligase [SAR202 cluster bacterium]
MLRIYNTLHKRLEEIETLEPGAARMYTCGPTVYRYAHIGNLRSYLMADWIKRALRTQGLKVTHVKNITDVGHMRQEQLERGGDKVILAALAEGKTPQQIADFYTQAFLQDEAKLNILPADHLPRATAHVADMQDIIGRLLKNGYAYKTGDNIYFSVAGCSSYGQLSGNTGRDLLEGVRAEADPAKRDPRDFTLWKRAEPGRAMKWDSPWGEGFPGWHIECSAMSVKYLGEEQDIHTGGVDNIFPHHEDEIAQSEAAFGKRYVKYWVHGQHLLADGVKMAKSAGNEFTLADLETRGFDPLAFRYLCLTVKYRHRLNFTFSALKAAQRALIRLQDLAWTWRHEPSSNGHRGASLKQWRGRFIEAVEDDLNLPKALSTIWDLSRSRLSAAAKLELMLEFDAVLGLGLQWAPSGYDLPPDATSSLKTREGHRQKSQFTEADKIRRVLAAQGYQVRDTGDGTLARPKTAFEMQAERWPSVSSASEVPSLVETPSTLDYSVVIAACNYLSDLQRCAGSVLRWCGGGSMELVIVDNGSTDGTSQWVEELKARDARVKVVHSDHVLGDAQAKNIGLKTSQGRIVALLDTSVELVSNPMPQWEELLSDPKVGMAGPWGLRSQDLHHFHEEVTSGVADVMQGYALAFRRELLSEVGLMRECFRFYRNLDLDFSFQFRDRGYCVLADGSLPMVRHEHRQWSALGEEERNQLSRKNFRHFFRRWGQRLDLLVAPKA